MKRQGKLAHQLMFWFLCLSLIPLAVVTAVSYRISVDSIEREVTNALNAVAKRQAIQLQAYLEERRRDVAGLSRSPLVVEALQKHEVPSSLAAFLRYRCEAAECPDLLLTRDRRVEFSANKRVPEGSLLSQPPLRDSLLAQNVEQCNTLLAADGSLIGPHPLNQEPTLFVTAPVLDEGNHLLGAVSMEVGTTVVERILQDYTGLSRTGETVLATVEPAGVRFLTSTRHAPEAGFQLREVSPGVRNLLQRGMEGVREEGLGIDYRSQPVIFVLRYLPQLQAAILIKIDQSEAFAPVARLRAVVAAVAFLTLLTVMAGAIRMAGAISQPLQQLKRGTEILAGGNLEHRLDVRANNEVGLLADAFNEMAGRLRRSMDDLRVTTESKERIESELQIASDIQLSLLPKIFPRFMHRPEFDAFAALVPAKEVGGDLYDFFLVDSTRLLFLVGDVSGKGVPAALFMAVTKTLFKASWQNAGLEALLERVNRELCEDNDSGMFVTVFCGLFDFTQGTLQFANAGHNRPYLLRSNGDVEMLPSVRGMGLGVFEEAVFETGETRLRDGDSLFLYTDGLTEAEDPRQQFYGEERLVEFLRGYGRLAPRALVAQCLTEVRDFAQGCPQSDDVTVMSLCYYGMKASSVDSNQLSVTLRSELEELGRLAEAVDAFGLVNSLSGRLTNQLNVALEELVSNVIQYQHCKLIQVDVLLQDGELRVRLQDDGTEFNPFAQQSPDLGLTVEERAVGGLGIHLVRQIFGEHQYLRTGGRNLVTLTRRVEDSPAQS